MYMYQVRTVHLQGTPGVDLTTSRIWIEVENFSSTVMISCGFNSLTLRHVLASRKIECAGTKVNQNGVFAHFKNGGCEHFVVVVKQCPLQLVLWSPSTI